MFLTALASNKFPRWISGVNRYPPLLFESSHGLDLRDLSLIDMQFIVCLALKMKRSSVQTSFSWLLSLANSHPGTTRLTALFNAVLVRRFRCWRWWGGAGCPKPKATWHEWNLLRSRFWQLLNNFIEERNSTGESWDFGLWHQLQAIYG